jgi:hypothetical protein
MRRFHTLFALLLITKLVSGNPDLNSWQNLTRLAPDQPLEVRKIAGESTKGNFVSVTAQSIELRVGQQNVSIPRSQVSRIRLRSGERKATWIGLALGAGAGAGLGAGIGSGLSNESGGDFSNLKPAVIGICAGVGALVGFAVGSILDNRHQTIYQAKTP